MGRYPVPSKHVGFLDGILDHWLVDDYVPWLKTTSEGKWGLKCVAHVSSFIPIIVAYV